MFFQYILHIQLIKVQLRQTQMGGTFSKPVQSKQPQKKVPNENPLDNVNIVKIPKKEKHPSSSPSTAIRNPQNNRNVVEIPEGGKPPSSSPSTIDMISNQYTLEPLETITIIQNRKFKYYWLDSNIYNEQNQNNSEYLKQNNIDLDGFASMAGMQSAIAQLHPNKKLKIICSASLSPHHYKYFQNNPRISEVFVFCKNEQKGKELMMKYPIIKIPVYTVQDLRKAILQAERYDSEYFERKRIHFFINEDKKYLNKYRLNYHCLLLKFDREIAKLDFMQYCQKVYPREKNVVSFFKKNYDEKKDSLDKIRQSMEWMSMDNIYWRSIDELLSQTILPQELAYLRLPFSDIYQAIYNGYQKQFKKVSQVFIVMDLSPMEISKLNASVGNFLMFTSFVRGFTNEGIAVNIWKRNKNSYIFRVLLQIGIVDDDYDYGYWIDEDQKQDANVFFNVFNFFKVMDLSVKEREVVLQYGAMADVIQRSKDPRKTKDLTQQEKDLFINWKYIQQEKNKIKKQTDLLKGFNIRSSIEATKKNMRISKSRGISQEESDEMKIEMGDLYLIQGDYSLAEGQYQMVTSEKIKDIATVKLAKLYLMNESLDKYENIEKRLNEAIYNLKKDKKVQEALNGVRELSIGFMRRKQFKKALTSLQDGVEYGVEEQINVESNPLMHELYQCRSACLESLNKKNEAKQLLQQVKQWQIKCEGSHSSNLMRTERQLQAIYALEGNLSQLRISEDVYSNVIREIDANEHQYAARNNSIEKYLDQSQIKVDISKS